MKKALTFALSFFCLALGLSRSSFGQDNRTSTPVVVAAESGNREQDKLNGPVRRVRVETAKIIPKDGVLVEGPREVLAVTTYEPAGRKIDTLTYPVASTTNGGKEHYVYDDKGNVVEMILRSADGSMLSKEAYKYEFDQLGNWTKRSSSVAVYENGKVTFEPTAITYRTISYYYNQAIEKLNAASAKTKETSAPSSSSTLLSNSNSSSTDSSRTSTPTTQVSTTVQPLSEAAIAHADKEAVSAPASVVPAKSNNAAPDSPVAASREIRATSDNAAATSVVKHLAEDVLRSAAIELPKPEYSDAARLARASGQVKVQILVDENGQVTNAQAMSGHPLLGALAETAARKARFSFSKTSSSPTKVYGVLSYDFVLPTSASQAVPASGLTIDSKAAKPVEPKRELTTIPERAAVAEPSPKVLANYSEAARSLYDQGVAFQASGRYMEAAASFNQAIKIDPNNANSYARLAMAYSALLKHKDAVPVYKMAHQINPTVLGAPAYYMWGHSYLALEKASEALSAFKQALDITRAETIDSEQKGPARYPSLEQLHYSIGIAHLTSRRFSDAIDELKQAVKLNPKNAEAHYMLAIAYISNRNRREAENQLTILKKLDSALAEKIASAIAVGGPPPGCRNIACR